MYIRRLKTGTYEFFKRLEKGGDASCNNDAQHRVAKNFSFPPGSLP
jgi:hypothetical protein